MNKIYPKLGILIKNQEKLFQHKIRFCFNIRHVKKTQKEWAGYNMNLLQKQPSGVMTPNSLLMNRPGHHGWNICQLAHKYGHLMFILFRFNYRASGVHLGTSSLHSMMWEVSQIYSGDPVMNHLPVKSPKTHRPAYDIKSLNLSLDFNEILCGGSLW